MASGGGFSPGFTEDGCMAEPLASWRLCFWNVASAGASGGLEVGCLRQAPSPWSLWPLQPGISAEACVLRWKPSAERAEDQFKVSVNKALEGIIPKATVIPVSAPPHTNTEEARINLQLQKEREKNEFCMRSIWSVCLLGDLISSDHRWYLTTPLLWWPCNGGNST